MSNDLAVGAGIDEGADPHTCPDPDCPHYDRDVANCDDHRCVRHDDNRNAPSPGRRSRRMLAPWAALALLPAGLTAECGPPPVRCVTTTVTENYLHTTCWNLEANGQSQRPVRHCHDGTVYATNEWTDIDYHTLGIWAPCGNHGGVQFDYAQTS